MVYLTSSNLFKRKKKIAFLNLNILLIYTINNCQRPVFSLGVSQHMHKITSCENLSSIGRQSFEIIIKEKKPSHTKLCAFRCLISRPQNLILKSRNRIMENYFFLKNYVTSEGAVSHNVLYHQPLPITRYQVRFYANNYFEYLPIVSTAFKACELITNMIMLRFVVSE